jgi:hypothetical protein
MIKLHFGEISKETDRIAVRAEKKTIGYVSKLTSIEDIQKVFSTNLSKLVLDGWNLIKFHEITEKRPLSKSDLKVALEKIILGNEAVVQFSGKRCDGIIEITSSKIGQRVGFNNFHGIRSSVSFRLRDLLDENFKTEFHS